MERWPGWELQIRTQARFCCRQMAKTSLLLATLFIYYLYLTYFQNRLEEAFKKKNTNVSELLQGNNLRFKKKKILNPANLS